MHAHAMISHPSGLHGALAVLAPPRRFQLLVLMLDGVDRSVSQLADAVGLSQSCTTRHLQALARAGLVKGTRDGKRVVFRVAPRDEAAREVLASVSRALGRDAGQFSPGEPRARRRAAHGEDSPPARRQRGAAARRSQRQVARILGAAIHIDSAIELEPPAAEPAPVDSLPEPESGITSDPSDAPVLRRGDLEDFLL